MDVLLEQPTWAPNIPKSKLMLPCSAASFKRPVCHKRLKEKDAAEDAELLLALSEPAVKSAATDLADASETALPLKRKAVGIPLPCHCCCQ